MTDNQFEFAQRHLRILSGLYGILRPLDLIQPYRLEMGTALSVGRRKDLYHFWQKHITDKISSEIKNSGSEYLINLASDEYFKSVDLKRLNAKVISPRFMDLRNGSYQVITFYAKKARGLMARFVIDFEITDPEALKAFNYEGYNFNPDMSHNNTLFFTREN